MNYTLKVTKLLEEITPENPKYQDVIDSVKFDLGDADDLDQLYRSTTGTFYQIPFPLCTFQLQVINKLAFFLAKRYDDGILWSIFWKEPDERWYYSKIDAFITRTEEGATDVVAIYIGKEPKPEMTDDLVKDVKAKLNEIAKFASIVEMFSCSNVAIQNHEVPEKLNKSRKKKGKLPLFSYHTVHIQEEYTRKNEEPNGTHASPRLHLRRGHIRKLTCGKRVWVSECWVGDKEKGVVEHDYALDK